MTQQCLHKYIISSAQIQINFVSFKKKIKAFGFPLLDEDANSVCMCVTELVVCLGILQ